MSKTIGIVGSRRRSSESDFHSCLCAIRSIYSPGDSFVSGGCPSGGDQFAERIAKLYNVPITIHHPDWSRFGRSAGLRRNSFIAEDADILVAVVSSDRRGGTEDTIRKFHALGKSDIVLV